MPPSRVLQKEVDRGTSFAVTLSTMDKNQLLALMKDHSITNGWDVVCAMSATQLTQLFQCKYEQKVESGTLHNVKGSTKLILGCADYDFDIGPPLISFIPNDPTRCQVRLLILKGTIVVKDTSGSVVLQVTIPSSPEDHHEYYINLIIPLGIVTGRVQGQDVVINVTSTEEASVNIQLDPMIDDAIQFELKEFFRSLDNHDWSIGTLNYTPNPDVPALTPKFFEFATRVDPNDTSKTPGCLVLFISTTGNRGGLKELSGVSVPYPSDRSAALIISSRLLFETIILPSMRKQISQNIDAKPKSDATLDAWHIVGRAKTTLDCGRINSLQEQDVEIPLDHFAVNGGDALTVIWNESWKNAVQYRHDVYPPGGGDTISVVSTGSVSLTLDLQNGSYQFTVSQAEVVTGTASWNPVIGGSKPSFWDGYAFGGAKDAVQKSVQTKLASIQSLPKLGVDVFAVSNLLFPADHVIHYETNDVFVPGDLVLFGTTKAKLGK